MNRRPHIDVSPSFARPPSVRGHRVSRSIYLIVVVAALGFATLGEPFLEWVGMAGTVVFLVLELRYVPRFQVVMAAVLVGAGVMVGVLAGGGAGAGAGGGGGGGDAVDIVLRGVAKAQIFLVLFFAIMWLQVPAGFSPALQAVRRSVVSQPPGRRFVYLAASGHFLGAVLNLGGLVLLSTMVERQKDPVLQRRMASALMQSYVMASAWSPFFVGVVVILIALPELSWIDIVAGGVPMALISVGIAWGYDRVRYRLSTAAPASTTNRSPAVPPGAPLGAPHGRHLFGVFGILIVLVIGMVEGTGLSLPVVLGFVAPPFGIVWMGVINGSTVPPLESAGKLVRTVCGRAEGLRSEALAFTASSIVGVGFAAGFPTDALSAITGQGGWIIFGLIFSVLGLGFVGVHPLVSVIIISEALPPDVLGMPVQIVGLSLLGVWGLATLVSPVSGTTLMLSRFVPVSSYTVAWRWNPPFALIAALAVALFVYAVWHMGWY